MKYFLTVIFMLIAGAVFADPSIDYISGACAHGDTILISGSGFGTKNAAAPKKYDDFESGTPGNALGNGWIYDGGDDEVTEYSALPSSRGVGEVCTRQYYWSWNIEDPTKRCTGVHLGLSTPWAENGDAAMYLSGWVYAYESHPDSGSHSTKWLQVQGPEEESGYPQYRLGGSSGGSWYQEVYNSNASHGGNPMSYDFSTPFNEGWQRHEVYIYFDDVVGTSGVFKNWVDLDLGANQTGLDAMKHADCGAERFLISWYYGMDSGTSDNAYANVYWDELYIDDTLARIEIGDNATFGSCTHREIQIPVTWATGEATAVLNRGAYDIGDTSYVFIVDSSGYRSSGEQIIWDTPVIVLVGDLSAGGANMTVQDGSWFPQGRVRYRAYNTDTPGVDCTTSYSAPGTTHGTLQCTGLTVGDDYRLEYYIDFNPNVSGYAEQWVATSVTWEQPVKGSPHESEFEIEE
jgi:hypothetical protein